MHSEEHYSFSHSNGLLTVVRLTPRDNLFWLHSLVITLGILHGSPPYTETYSLSILASNNKNYLEPSLWDFALPSWIIVCADFKGNATFLRAGYHITHFMWAHITTTIEVETCRHYEGATQLNKGMPPLLEEPRCSSTWYNSVLLK